MQRNWIGKSRGTRVRFAVEGMARTSIEVFTTRVDTIYGASALILAPNHPLVDKLLENAGANTLHAATLQKLRQASLKTADIEKAEKEGFFVGQYAVNPFNGEKIPIWVGNFVLMGYGTGAVMCVPAHDERDFEFAVKYKLAIPIVVQPSEGEPFTRGDADGCVYGVREIGELGAVHGIHFGKSERNHDGGCRGARVWEGRDYFSAEGLGDFAAAVLGDADPGDLLRRMRDGAGAGRGFAGGATGDGEIFRCRAIAAGERGGIREREVPEVRRSGAAGDGHDGHVRGFIVVFLPVRGRAQR